MSSKPSQPVPLPTRRSLSSARCPSGGWASTAVPASTPANTSISPTINWPSASSKKSTSITPLWTPPPPSSPPPAKQSVRQECLRSPLSLTPRFSEVCPPGTRNSLSSSGGEGWGEEALSRLGWTPVSPAQFAICHIAICHFLILHLLIRDNSCNSCLARLRSSTPDTR